MVIPYANYELGPLFTFCINSFSEEPRTGCKGTSTTRAYTRQRGRENKPLAAIVDSVEELPSPLVSLFVMPVARGSLHSFPGFLRQVFDGPGLVRCNTMSALCYRITVVLYEPWRHEIDWLSSVVIMLDGESKVRYGDSRSVTRPIRRLYSPSVPFTVLHLSCTTSLCRPLAP